MGLQLTRLSEESVLFDIACGTGDFAIEARKQGVKKIFGADLSSEMLKFFIKKSDWIDGWVFQTTAEDIAIKNDSITNITVAFGVRNFYDIQSGFNSFHRILKKDGKATILEFQMPENNVFKSLYGFYFKKILPAVGGAISKDRDAYNYLPESVEEFDEKINIKDLLLKAGFKSVESYSLTLGIVRVIIAIK